MNLIESFASQRSGTMATIAGAGMQEGIPARQADAGWPLGVVRWVKTGELIVADYHFHVLWRIDGDGILHRFAGTGIPGYTGDGGAALQARLDCPHDLAQDGEGNIYFSDLKNQVYRRIDADTHTITTIAGSGAIGRGGDGGLATEAEMDTHCGIAVADNGDIYLASEWANNIRRIDARTGIIELFAGRDARHHPSERDGSRPASGQWLSLGGYSGDGGPKEEAGFYHPEHLALDSRGDLYVCDNSNDRIRKIDMETGMVSTVLGNGQRASNGDGGPAVQASTLMPDAICVDVHDNLYVGEKYGFRVRKVDAATGVVTTIAGTGVPGMGAEDVAATATQCNSIEVGIWADPDGTVFFSDCGGRLRRVDGRTGRVTTALGGTSVHDGEVATSAFLCGPWGLSLGPDGHIYFADQWNQRIRAIDPETGFCRTIAGNGARAYGGDGGPALGAYLGNPSGVSVDARGRVVIADGRHGHVRRVDRDGIIHNLAGAAFQWDKGDGGPAVNANLVDPVAVAHDAAGHIYIGDGGVGRIRKIDAETGLIDSVVGTGIQGYAGDGGPANGARIGKPTAIAFDEAGALYFTDALAHVVRRVDKDGVIATIVGTGEPGFSPDGTPVRAARLDSPHGVVAAGHGSLYIADTGNNCVRRLSSDGRLETVAGAGDAGYCGDGGPAVGAGLSSPMGLCMYGDEVLLIADHFNHRIRAIKLASL